MYLKNASRVLSAHYVANTLGSFSKQVLFDLTTVHLYGRHGAYAYLAVKILIPDPHHVANHLANDMLKFHWLLVLLLALPNGALAWNINSDLIRLITEHLKVPVSQITSSSTLLQHFSIRTKLQGTGFHRKLEINIYHALDAYSLRQCQLAVLQPLPSSIYADPYQLEDLTRASSSSNTGSRSEGEAAEIINDGTFKGGSAPTCAYTFTLLGPLDLELPAPACKSNILLLEFNLTQQQWQQQIGASLSVPLHAKYPEPRAFGFTGWQALSSGHVHLSVPMPWLLMDCRSTGGTLHVMQQRNAPQQQDFNSSAEAEGEAGDQQQHQRPEALVWSIPAGNLDHLQLVSWGTLVVSVLCSGVLIMKALQLLVSSGKQAAY